MSPTLTIAIFPEGKTNPEYTNNFLSNPQLISAVQHCSYKSLLIDNVGFVSKLNKKTTIIHLLHLANAQAASNTCIKNAVVNGSSDNMLINKKSNKNKYFKRELNVRFVNRRFISCLKTTLSAYLLTNSKSDTTKTKDYFCYFSFSSFQI